MKKYLVVILLFVCSCNAIRKDYNKLFSRTISFPKHCAITVLGRDTVIPEFFSIPYKLIVYVDSTKCTSCEINKMFLWNPVIDYVSNYNRKLRLYFIFSTTKAENVRLGMRANFFDYPVLIDTIGEFEQLNPCLPSNNAMHTFLLDERDNIIMIGNPARNKEIEKMFYEEVEKRLK